MPFAPGVTAAPLGAWYPYIAEKTPGEALGGLWATRTGWHRMAPMGPTYRACLGHQCACERISWTFSHICMIIVDADSHICRRDHAVLCCPLHGRSGRCVPDTVGSNRRLIGWSSATVMARIKARVGLFECCSEHCAARQGLTCPCAALESPQGPHASCVVSVRWFLGVRLAGTGLLMYSYCVQWERPQRLHQQYGCDAGCSSSTLHCLWHPWVLQAHHCPMKSITVASYCWCNRWGRSHCTQ